MHALEDHTSPSQLDMMCGLQMTDTVSVLPRAGNFNLLGGGGSHPGTVGGLMARR